MGLAQIFATSNYTLLHNLTGHSNHVYSVDFSPDGQLLLTTSLDGTARLWRVSDGQCMRVIEGGGGIFGKFSADGRTFFTTDGTGSVDFIPGTGTLKYWRTCDGKLLESYDNLGAGPIAVSPAGRHFAYGRSDGALVVAYLPLLITGAELAGDQTILRWTGGSGRYQVQQRYYLEDLDWEDVGEPTTATSATNTFTGNIFYRVQSLPNP